MQKGSSGTCGRSSYWIVTLSLDKLTFIMARKHVCLCCQERRYIVQDQKPTRPLLWSESPLSLSSKAIFCTRLVNWEQRHSMSLLARGLETQECDGTMIS